MPVTIDVRLAPDAEAVVSSFVAGGEDVASLDLAISQARINVEAARREVARISLADCRHSAPGQKLPSE